MTSDMMIGAVAALLFGQAPMAASAVPAADPWSESGGAAEAARVIASCLANSSSGPRHSNYVCIDQPGDDCRDQHGQTQMALNECTAFALAAWRKRLEEQVHRTRAAAGPHAAPFDAAQKAWRSWNEQECDFQFPPAATGSMLGELRADCALTHTAQPALELEALADDWEAHPPN